MAETWGLNRTRPCDPSPGLGRTPRPPHDGQMKIPVQPLTKAAFAPFGTVIETEGANSIEINQGYATRFHALTAADPGADGRAILSVFRARQRPLPLAIPLIERHPLGTQAFVPLSPQPWLVVVGTDTAKLKAFRATGNQGVQINRDIWHAPLLILSETQEFLVIDRDGPGDNLEERLLDPAPILDLVGG